MVKSEFFSELYSIAIFQNFDLITESFYIVNYYVKSLGNENINTGVFVVFKTKREMPKQTIFLEPPVFFCFHY